MSWYAITQPPEGRSSGGGVSSAGTPPRGEYNLTLRIMDYTNEILLEYPETRWQVTGEGVYAVGAQVPLGMFRETFDGDHDDQGFLIGELVTEYPDTR